MKFARLSSSELESLEKEFIAFLAVNGIDSDYWIKLKETDNEKAEDLVDVFSDIVWKKNLDEIKFLEHRTNNSLKLFHCKKNTIELIGIDGDIQHYSTKKPNSSTSPKLSIYTHAKSYSRSREDELFALIKGGCCISDEKLYSELKKFV